MCEVRAIKQDMELVAGSGATSRVKSEQVWSVLTCDREDELVRGEVATLGVKAKEGDGSEGGKDLKVLSRKRDRREQDRRRKVGGKHDDGRRGRRRCNDTDL